MEAGTTHDHSLKSLIRELRDETMTLVQQEVSLAKVEMSENASRVTKNSIYLVAGGLLGYAVLVLLLLVARDALAVALVNGGMHVQTAIWLAPLIVAAVAGLIALVLILKGKKALREGVVPKNTIQRLREDKEWITRKFQHT